MKKMLIILVLSIIFLSGCDQMSVLCGNDICEDGEEMLCPNDCSVVEKANDIIEQVVEQKEEIVEVIEKKAEKVVEEIEEIIKEEPVIEEVEEIILTEIATDMDLKDFPNMFKNDYRFDGVVVVGDKAPASDVVAAVDILNGISRLSLEVEAAKLASEISNIEAQNIISIGSGCVNPITYEIMGNPLDCNAGLKSGIGRITFYKKSDKVAMVVDGYSDNDVRRAATVLGNTPNKLSGSKACIYGTDLKVEKITNCEETKTVPIIVLEKENPLTDIMGEGDMKTYSIAGKDYEVTVDYIGNQKVKFSVNGEITDTLGRGESYEFASGRVIEVITIMMDEFKGDQVEFIIK